MKKFYPDIRKVQIKTGLWSVIIALILLFSYLWLTNRLTMNSSYTLSIGFEDVNGLEVGDKVVYRGMEVGRIRSIKASGDRIIVSAGIGTEISLKEDSKFMVADSGLMGGKTLVISPGNGTAKLEAGKVHEGSTPEGIMNMISKASSTLNELQETLIAVKEPGGVLDGSQQLLKTADGTLKSTEKAVTELKTELSGAVTRVDRLTAEINDVLQENREPLKNTIADTRPLLVRINGTLDSLQTLSNNLNIAAKTMNSGDGTAARLLNDDQLYQKLNTSIENLDTLIKDIKANPKKYVKFSLF